jgi:hypothetical protein
VSWSQDLFDHANNDWKLKKNITGDEIWVYGFTMGLKKSPRLKKAQQVQSNVKVMVTFLLCRCLPWILPYS